MFKKKFEKNCDSEVSGPYKTNPLDRDSNTDCCTATIPGRMGRISITNSFYICSQAVPMGAERKRNVKNASNAPMQHVQFSLPAIHASKLIVKQWASAVSWQFSTKGKYLRSRLHEASRQCCQSTSIGDEHRSVEQDFLHRDCTKGKNSPQKTVKCWPGLNKNWAVHSMNFPGRIP